MNTLTLPIVGLLLLTPLCIAIGQLLFKISSEKLVSTGSSFHTVMFNPVFIFALGIYGSATLLWIYVLKSVPLTYAYSFMALSFVFVPILAFFFLQEQFTVRYFVGAMLIISGLAIIQN